MVVPRVLEKEKRAVTVADARPDEFKEVPREKTIRDKL
jgi:hypothetical protein